MLNRRKLMLKMLGTHQSATVHQLVEWLGASPATIRRDLRWLNERRLVDRRHGGVDHLARDRPLASLSGTFRKNMGTQTAAKRAIAQFAASLCHDGETVIINGGTTTFHMAKFLEDKRLAIYTNSFLMAERLLSTSDNEVYLTGGKIYREQNVMVTPFDDSPMPFVSKMFTSVYAVSTLGLMEADPLLVQTEQRLMNQADKLIVMVDGEKFTRKAGLILSKLSRVSCIITDSSAPAAVIGVIKHSGIKVILVDAGFGTGDA
ncbi:transcriptional regulator, DeoR family [Duganella sp. CF402]|uniref:DeoR/GlpR family DNA-binding transcription regulator n=1 Tax=unclassified Duganella TaxID=2636909 RepID=UPI0008B65048|nr:MULTISPECIES: DeoR/GlpR family DNA-binding transcription regulator [unclassified Duganella]RZT08188.1 DeoR family transcriptional regulator [Duganella sp. BK701]SEM02739.1 transcriptional regulator, DeoR family [Duganella sp. CF402]